MSIQQRGSSFRAEVMIDGRRFSKSFKTRSGAAHWVDMIRERERRGSRTEEGYLLSLVPRRVLEAVEATKYSEMDLVRGSVPVGHMTGVYFLILDNRVVYVGQSRNLFHRLSQHKRGGMEFDAYNFIPCPPEEMDELERQYIMALWPESNRRFR